MLATGTKGLAGGLGAGLGTGVGAITGAAAKGATAKGAARDGDGGAAPAELPKDLRWELSLEELARERLRLFLHAVVLHCFGERASNSEHTNLVAEMA